MKNDENDEMTVVGVTDADMRWGVLSVLHPDDSDVKAYFARRQPYLRAYFDQRDDDGPVSAEPSVRASAGGVGRDAKRSARR